MKRGVVYACSHPAWMNEAIRSAQSCKVLMPELARELYLPRLAANMLPTVAREAFTKIIGLEKVVHPSRPRFEAMEMTELDEAIFMDGDTLFLSSVMELFDVLGAFDLALGLAMRKANHLSVPGLKRGIYDLLPVVPIVVPEWNAGVLVVKISDNFRAFAREWSHWFQVCLEHQYKKDQPAFRSVLYHSKLRVLNLPSNYNFRARLPQYVFDQVHILHAHGDLVEIAKTINQDAGRRHYEPDPTLVYGHMPKDLAVFKAMSVSRV